MNDSEWSRVAVSSRRRSVVLVFWPPCAFHLSSHLTHGTAHATAGRPQVVAHITLPHTHTQACIATYSVVRPVWWLVIKELYCPNMYFTVYHADSLRQILAILYSYKLISSNPNLQGNAIPAGCKAKCWAPRVELIAIPIVTICSVWHKVCVRLCMFWKISAPHLRILWRHLLTQLRIV